ncbi:hypothetical protein GCM10027200_73280 [Lentzea nigeriaca]
MVSDGDPEHLVHAWSDADTVVIVDAVRAFPHSPAVGIAQSCRTPFRLPVAVDRAFPTECGSLTNSTCGPNTSWCSGSKSPAPGSTRQWRPKSSPRSWRARLIGVHTTRRTPGIRVTK